MVPPNMLRYLKIFKFAWLIAWNLALLCLVLAVPLLAIFKGGWIGAVFLFTLGCVVFVLKHPAFAFGMGLGGHR